MKLTREEFAAMRRGADFFRSLREPSGQKQEI